MKTESTPKKSPCEKLRDGHCVSKCGVATLEYLIGYASKVGIKAGEATKAGKTQHGKHTSLLVKDGVLVRASFVEDIKGNRKLRRLSAKKFVRICDAMLHKPQPIKALPITASVKQLALFAQAVAA